MVKNLKLITFLVLSTIIALIISISPSTNSGMTVNAADPTPTPTIPPTEYALGISGKSLSVTPMDQPEVKIVPPNVIAKYFASYTFAPGTQVQVTHLNPTPRPGLVYDVCTFVRWEGDATGTANPITITMDGHKSLVACYNVVHYDLRTPTPTSRVTTTPTPIRVTPTPYRRPSLIPEYYISTGGATNITATSATLGGYARLQGYTSITISISCTGGTKTFGGSGVATVSNPSVSVNVTGLEPDTQYSYYAYSGSGGPGGHNGNLSYFRTLPADTTITPTPTPTNTPTPTRTITPTPTPVPGGYVVSYVIQSDWGNGATVSVTITNKSAAAVNGWTLAFTFPGNQTISNLWNGTYTQTGASVSVKDAGHNASIPANNGSVNFGFNLNYSGSNAKPTSFTLNGTACQVQ